MGTTFPSHAEPVPPLRFLLTALVKMTKRSNEGSSVDPLTVPLGHPERQRGISQVQLSQATKSQPHRRNPFRLNLLPFAPSISTMHLCQFFVIYGP